MIHLLTLVIFLTLFGLLLSGLGEAFELLKNWAGNRGSIKTKDAISIELPVTSYRETKLSSYHRVYGRI